MPNTNIIPKIPKNPQRPRLPGGGGQREQSGPGRNPPGLRERQVRRALQLHAPHRGLGLPGGGLHCGFAADQKPQFVLPDGGAWHKVGAGQGISAVAGFSLAYRAA